MAMNEFQQRDLESTYFRSQICCLLAYWKAQGGSYSDALNYFESRSDSELLEMLDEVISYAHRQGEDTTND